MIERFGYRLVGVAAWYFGAVLGRAGIAEQQELSRPLLLFVAACFIAFGIICFKVAHDRPDHE